MSDRNLKSIDTLGSRLSSGFQRAEAAEAAKPAGRRFRPRFAIAAAGVAVIAAVLAVFVIGRGEAERVFTVEEALAAVAAAAFDEPQVQPNKFLFTRTESKHLFSQSVSYSAEQKLETQLLTTTQSERWTSAKQTSWVRTISKRGKFMTEQDRLAAEQMKTRNEAEAAKMRRKKALRGDRRPVPSLFTNFPLDSALDPSLPETDTFVCRIPASASGLFDGRSLPAHLPSPESIPASPRMFYKLLRAKTKGFVENIDRDRSVWDTTRVYLEGGATRLTPTQRSTVVKSMAFIPGVTTMGLTKDPLGRSAFGFARESGNVRYEIFFDSRTSLPTYSVSRTTGKLRGSRAHLPVGTTLMEETLHDYEYLDAPPKLQPSKRTALFTGGQYCPNFNGREGRQLRAFARQEANRQKRRDAK